MADLRVDKIIIRFEEPGGYVFFAGVELEPPSAHKEEWEFCIFTESETLGEPLKDVKQLIELCEQRKDHIIKAAQLLKEAFEK